jgi:TonB family protein
MIGAFGATMPALLFSALQLMTVNHGGAPPMFVAHKIEFKFVPPKETPTPPRPEKVAPEPLVELPPVLEPTGGRDGGGPRVAPRRGDQPVAPVVWRPGRPALDTITGTDDNDPQPLVRILPDYPPNGRGDGWVLLRFNISPAGTVTDAAIIDAKPRGIFDKNALRAIERWRYRPAVVDGRAVERRGLQVRLVFELEQA